MQMRPTRDESRSRAHKSVATLVWVVNIVARFASSVVSAVASSGVSIASNVANIVASSVVSIVGRCWYTC